MSKIYIRTQDREKLVFLENDINCVEYRDISEQEKWYDSHAVIAGSVLGIYETKARCLEILDEIQSMCLSYYKSSGGFSMPDMLFDMPTVYQMPEK